VSNVLSEEKKKQIIALGQLGWSLRRIEKATGVRRETAGEYLKVADIAVRPPGAWGKRAPAKPANEVTTDSSGAASACEPYRELLEHGVACGRNAMAIWQELVDRHAFPGSYESVKRFVRKQRGTQSPEARAVILTAAGEEAQVDYGIGPLVRDPETANTAAHACSC
jgi:transposase